MLREAFSERLKQAMRAKDARTVSTMRLVLAGLKDRDIAARGGEHAGTIPEAEILRLLQGMVKQRRDSIAMYQQGNRPELAQQEEEEIAVIESFMPKQMSDDDIAAAVKGAIGDIGATGIKDMGKVMAALRERHAGVIDMARAGAVVKQQLG
ncbi:MAG TPA: GatB/YqeY domain-containing protein [Stellaceae bacterium]|nr:GatB/YqeY domain-containing protein [Stellaceae bacterium]